MNCVINILKSKSPNSIKVMSCFYFNSTITYTISTIIVSILRSSSENRKTQNQLLKSEKSTVMILLLEL